MLLFDCAAKANKADTSRLMLLPDCAAEADASVADTSGLLFLSDHEAEANDSCIFDTSGFSVTICSASDAGIIHALLTEAPATDPNNNDKGVQHDEEARQL